MTPPLKFILESLLFVTEEPLSVQQFKSILETEETEAIRAALEELAQEYDHRGGGFELRQVAGGYQLRTRSEYSEWVKKLLKPSPARLSRAALETLAIIAYKQPIIRADVEHIRGVDCGGVLRMLLEKKLIRVMGRKDIPGRPMIYGTTRQFLEVFNLKDLRDLPSPKEIESLGAEIEADSLFAESAEANAMLIEGTLPMASDKADPQTSNQQAPDHSPTAGTNQALTIHLPEPVPGDAAEETAATVLADPPPTEKPPESAASENAARTSQDPSAAHGTLPVSEDTESASPQDREDGKTS